MISSGQAVNSRTVIDPVCGMQVPPEPASASIEFGGETYYFCCPRCRTQFAANPQGYVSGLPTRSAVFSLEPPPLGAVTIGPTHPGLEQDPPGSCPERGMDLELKTLPSTMDDDLELESMTRRFWLGLVFGLPVILLATFGVAMETWISHQINVTLQALLTSVVVLGCGWPLLARGVQSLRTGYWNGFLLISLGLVAAFGYSLLASLLPSAWFPAAFRQADGRLTLYFGAAALITVLVLLGQVLELRARQRAGKAIREFLSLTPPMAHRVDDSQEQAGPRSQIVHRVAAARRRAPIQRAADLVVGYFVPAVVGIAVLTFLGWSLWGPEPSMAYALMNAIAVLIVACPRALGLAVPMSNLVGLGRGATAGILIKEAEVLETLAKVTILLVDKTGTLTEGRPQLVDVFSASSLTVNELLRLAASVEQHSEHPLGRAVAEGAKSRGLELSPVEAFQSTPGGGVSGRLEDKTLCVGALEFLHQHQVPVEESLVDQAEAWRAQGRTVTFVAFDHQAVGLLAVADPIKPSTPKALKALRKLGLQVIMLTGDHPKTARAVAESLHITDYEAQMRPEKKPEHVKWLQADGQRVAMAGDGIHDAPALAAADVGIVLGTGPGAAIPTADVTLVNGDLEGIVSAIQLSRAVRRNGRQNLVFAFIYNGLSVPVAAAGWLNPIVAAAAMSLSSVAVITNALWLRWPKR